MYLEGLSDSCLHPFVFYCVIHVFLPPSKAYSMGQLVSALQPLANCSASDSILLLHKKHIHSQNSTLQY